jgi:hypothetical protein
MWAQYGTTQNKEGKDSKSYMNGACIELDMKKIISKLEYNKSGDRNENGIVGLTLFNIDYVPESEYYNLYYKKDISIEDDMKFKYEHWQEEQEFRALYSGNNQFFDITDSIKRIYLGADFRHEHVRKLCEIISRKRYENITPSTFVRITIGKGGLLYNDANDSGGIWSDMIEILQKIAPKYYDEISEDKNIGKFFYGKLKKEQQVDEEIQKLNATFWKDKYISIMREKDKLKDEVKHRDLQLIEALQKTNSLQEKIISLNEELGEIKNELVAGVSDVVTALTRIAL